MTLIPHTASSSFVSSVSGAALSFERGKQKKDYLNYKKKLQQLF